MLFSRTTYWHYTRVLLALIVSCSALTAATPLSAQTEDSTLVLRPHCSSGYSEEDWIFGPIPHPGFVVETGNGKCSFFEVHDPQTLKTPELKVGDVLDIDIVAHNPGGKSISRARAWLSYDPNILEGKDVTVTNLFPQVTPGESDFSEAEGYVKIEATADEDARPTDIWIPVARVRFTVLKTVETGTPITFFDVQRGGHTELTADDDGNEEHILEAEPGSLLVVFESHNAADDEDGNDSTSSDSTAGGVGDSCSENGECQSGICYEGSCQGAGFKFPDGAACERDNQCLSLLCKDSICTSASDLPDGENCTANDECASGFCGGGICQEQAQTNSGTSDNEPKANGESCEQDNECQSGICANGACRPDLSSETIPPPPRPDKAPNGDACITNDQCESGNCENGECTEKKSSQEKTRKRITQEPAERTAFSLLQIQNLSITTEGSSVYLAWDQIPSSINEGYNIYYGTTTGQYIQRKSIPDNFKKNESANVRIKSLPKGTIYYFAVRAVSNANEESAFSQEVSIEVNNPDSSSNPLVASMLDTFTDGDDPVKKPIKEGDTDVLPGETGVGSTFALFIILSAFLGTVIASRRQVVVGTHPNSHE